MVYSGDGAPCYLLMQGKPRIMILGSPFTGNIAKWDLIIDPRIVPFAMYNSAWQEGQLLELCIKSHCAFDLIPF